MYFLSLWKTRCLSEELEGRVLEKIIQICVHLVSLDKSFCVFFYVSSKTELFCLYFQQLKCLIFLLKLKYIL